MIWGVPLLVVRWVLLITLSIVLLLVLYRRFRYRVLSTEVPVVKHAELTKLEVGYHPTRLDLLLTVPRQQRMSAELLDADWRSLHRWPSRELDVGRQEWSLPLDVEGNGMFYLRLVSGGQSTERRFTVKNA